MGVYDSHVHPSYVFKLCLHGILVKEWQVLYRTRIVKLEFRDQCVHVHFFLQNVSPVSFCAYFNFWNASRVMGGTSMQISSYEVRN